MIQTGLKKLKQLNLNLSNKKKFNRKKKDYIHTLKKTKTIFITKIN